MLSPLDIKILFDPSTYRSSPLHLMGDVWPPHFLSDCDEVASTHRVLNCGQICRKLESNPRSYEVECEAFQGAHLEIPGPLGSSAGKDELLRRMKMFKMACRHGLLAESRLPDILRECMTPNFVKETILYRYESRPQRASILRARRADDPEILKRCKNGPAESILQPALEFIFEKYAGDFHFAAEWDPFLLAMLPSVARKTESDLWILLLDDGDDWRDMWTRSITLVDVSVPRAITLGYYFREILT